MEKPDSKQPGHIGETNLNRLVPICPHDHHRIHEGGWTLTLDTDPSRTITLTRPDDTVEFHGPSITRPTPSSQRPDGRPGGLNGSRRIVAAPYDAAMADLVTIRPIEPADAESYLAVFATVAAEGKWIGTEVPIPPERATRIRASAEASTADRFTAVAVTDDGTVIGFARADLDHGRAHLGMAILDGFRGMGLGRRLLDRCIAWARDQGLHKVELDVWPHNTAARHLYESAGFVVEGRRRRHWRRSNGELWDSIDMGLVLDEVSPGSPYEEP